MECPKCHEKPGFFRSPRKGEVHVCTKCNQPSRTDELIKIERKIPNFSKIGYCPNCHQTYDFNDVVSLKEDDEKIKSYTRHNGDIIKAVWCPNCDSYVWAFSMYMIKADSEYSNTEHKRKEKQAVLI